MNKNKNLNILLYFPYRGIGGVSRVFLNIQNLYKSSKIKLVDLEDGYMSKNTVFNKSIIDPTKTEKYPKNSIVIFQSFLFWNLKDIKKFPKNTRLIFWNLHPYNLYPYLISNQGSIMKKYLFVFSHFFSFLRKKKIKKLIEYLSKENSIFFMDYENKIKTEEFFDLKIPNDSYLPIFTKTNFPKRDIVNNKKILRLGYLGRLVDFKINTLIHLLNRLDRLETQFEFHVIGMGTSKKELVQAQKKLKNIKLFFHGEIDIERNDQILYEIDLFFAMGHSILELTARSIPVISMNYSYSKIKKYLKFSWAFENNNYNLAEEVKNDSHFEKSCSLAEKIIDLGSNYQFYCNRSLEWVSKYYSEQTFKIKFDEIIDNSSANFKDLIKYKLDQPDLISFVYKRIRNKKDTLSYFNQH